MERIERVRAEERRNINLKQNSSDTQNFVEREKGETVDIVASKLGIGSGETYRKEKYIVDNADSSTLSDWDKGDISTHAAYVKIKQEKDELEKKVKHLENKEPITIEVDNTDYTSIKRKTKELEQLQDIVRGQ